MISTEFSSYFEGPCVGTLEFEGDRFFWNRMLAQALVNDVLRERLLVETGATNLEELAGWVREGQDEGRGRKGVLVKVQEKIGSEGKRKRPICVRGIDLGVSAQSSQELADRVGLVYRFNSPRPDSRGIVIHEEVAKLVGGSCLVLRIVGDTNGPLDMGVYFFGWGEQGYELIQAFVREAK